MVVNIADPNVFLSKLETFLKQQGATCVKYGKDELDFIQKWEWDAPNWYLLSGISKGHIRLIRQDARSILEYTLSFKILRLIAFVIILLGVIAKGLGRQSISWVIGIGLCLLISES